MTLRNCFAREKVSINILVDEVENKVLFVQAGKDFVDVLLSFLMLPLGTIARLVSKESSMKKVSIGSISSMYESVVNLEEKLFWTATSKEMLLRPRNSMEEYCQNMKLRIDGTEKTKYYICKYNGNHLLSTFKNQRCKCGRPMNREISYATLPANKGFVPDAATFFISDDLNVKPDNFQSTICKPKHLGYEGLDCIKLVTVNVTKKEILDLLKCSLVSDTPLTDVFLLKKQFHENAQSIGVLNFDNAVDAEENGPVKTIQVKVIVRKSNGTILFALGDEDFADFVLSFLTFPMVGVEHMLNGNSNMGSMDNLYQSMLDLDPRRYLRSSDLEDSLKKYRLAHQIFPIGVPTLDSFCVSKYDKRSSKYDTVYLTTMKNNELLFNERRDGLSYLKPQSSIRFTKSPSLYMVTDDLVVTPGSSASTIAFLTKLRIPPSDLEEKVINIGKKEGLSLMKASLISSSALTNGLGPFLETLTNTLVNNDLRHSNNSEQLSSCLLIVNVANVIVGICHSASLRILLGFFLVGMLLNNLPSKLW